ncbi:N(4)-(Beta-N-acetylglucosaminyl)-L-asparaginase-like [Harmonia axyridis]|uniref:N(4)-(Beta-N-acetylglucosaminyl)-L-asparaginase- like n=1 Tax=Harmonia axyridis TaxID=115357 RepID=UPI001E279B96|nr:N(4)-(Beta-N-acetylglucosaminyl)-L-asparaginase-like [Harmonia axyridis]
MMFRYLLIVSFTSIVSSESSSVVINTWNFSNATRKAWEVLLKGGSSIDALTTGCTVCEVNQCDFTVGFGGSPDENGETTLDAMIFDGTKINMGAVGALRRIKNAIGVARDVLEYSEHSILVGELATQFAKELGYKEESLTTKHSKDMYDGWKGSSCQPNFWKDVIPDPKHNCGPYERLSINDINYNRWSPMGIENHDTIGMVVMDESGNIAAGTSSNGAKFKIPGRVGDAPLPGAGAYADSEIGGAAATGDGDIMMRFLPSFLAVEEMKRGSSPSQAAEEAISRILKKFPTFFGAVIALNKKGEHGAACNGMDVFPYCIADINNKNVILKYVKCHKEK